MRATDGQQTMDQPSHCSPELEKCRADLATCRDDLARRRDDLTARRDDLTARRDDRAPLMNAAWRDVEVTVPSAETSGRHCRGNRRLGRREPSDVEGDIAACSTRPSRASSEAHRVLRRLAHAMRRSFRMRRRPSAPARRLVPVAEATVPSCIRDVSRCRVTSRLWRSHSPVCRAYRSCRRDDLDGR